MGAGIGVMRPSSQTSSAKEGRRGDSRQITSAFVSQFRYDLVISSQSYENMKKWYEHFLSKSVFEIEIEHLGVMILVLNNSIHLTFSQK